MARKERYPGSEEKTERNAEVMKLHEEGVGILSLGRRFKVSPTRIRQIIDQETLKRG